MGSAVNKYILIFMILSIATTSFTQNVFNKAFDQSNTANLTSNALEYSNQYYFTQSAYITGAALIQGVILDTNGQMVLKKTLVSNTSFDLYYGYAGALQYLSNNEFCQLYNIGLDSILQLVFFDNSLNVIRNTEFVFNNYVNAGVLKQINDSTLLALGRVKVANDYNLVLINTDLQGNERWTTIFGETGKDDYGFAIEYLNDKIIVGGQTDFAHPQIFEFNNAGQLLFDTTYTQFDNGGHLSSHQNYGLYLSGIMLKSYGRHPYLVSLNNDFTINWSKEYFSNDTSVAITQMIINQNGTLTMSGVKLVNNEFSGLFFQTNSQGDSLGSKIIDHLPGKLAAFNDIRPTSDGGYIMAGETKAPTQDSWIVKVNAWGCDNIPCIVSVPEVPEDTQGSLICYPNPSSGTGTIKGSFNNASSTNQIKIYNSIGQLILSKTITKDQFQITVQLPAKGIYFIALYQSYTLLKYQKWVVQ